MIVVNVGSDITLFEPGSEAAQRQELFARALGLRQIFIVRLKRHARVRAARSSWYTAHACRTWHWCLFPLLAARVALLRVRVPVRLVATQDASIHGLAGVLLSRLLGARLLVSVFGDEIDNPELRKERPLYRVFDTLARWVLGRADAIRTDSEEMCAKLRRLGFTNTRFIPFMITGDAAYLGLERTYHEARPLKLLVVARLEEQKNVAMALRSLALSGAAGTEITVVGDGTQRAGLERLAAELGIATRVEFRGAVDYAQLPACFARADAFILSSRHETSARVLALASMSGLPVVTTRTTGAAEIIADGKTGIIVGVDDDAAMATAIGRLHAPSVREALGRAGRERMRASYSQERILAELGRLYRSLS